MRGERVPGTFADTAQAEAPAAVARATAAASASRDSGFGEKNRFVGRLGYSADGLGQNGSGGSLQTDVPPGAAVRLAHLYGSYYQGTPSQQARTIRFGGQDVELTTIPTNAGSYLSAARADVTAQVTAAFAAGTRSFRIDDDPGGLDGVALLVVYEDPSLPVSSIAVVDGGAAQSGQRTTLTFGAPLDPAAAGFTATMSLGIGYGYQGGTPGSTCGTSSRQSSIIDVNDRGLTSCAGHYDDGVGNDGGLISVGGVGDSTDNPADPVQQPADGRSPRVVDDELYDLKPFVRAGDRTLVVDTLNPSSDDLIFLTVLAISARIETVTSVPVGQTFGTGGSGHGGNPSGYQADPVNSRTGFFTSAMTDAVLAARGPALRLDRTYTSGDDRSSLLGRGWSSTWDTSLVVGRDDVTLVAEDGQRLVYERGLGGALVPPTGARSTLRTVEDGYELVRKDGLRYRFDGEGRLRSRRDARALGHTVQRSAAGEITGVVDDAGRRTSFTTEAGRLVAVALPDGRTVRYGYDDALLTSVTDVRGGVTRYGYDDAGRLTTVTDQHDVTLLTNTYDQAGRVVTQVDAAGARTSFAWDEDTLTSTMTDATSGAWQDVYDEDGRLSRRIDPVGGTTTLTWDADLNITAVADPSGDVTTYRYDERGNLVEVVAPDGLGDAQFTYDANSDVTSVTDGKSGTTSLSYDPARNLTAVTGPLQATARMAYEDGLPTAVVDRRGGTTRLQHDDVGNLVAATSPSGAVSRYEYDSSGRVVRTTDPTGRSSRLAYDAAGNLVHATDALGRVIRWTYDAAGRRTSSTDAAGSVRRYAYDAVGRLTTVTAADGGTTRYAYDGAGRITSRTDANGHTTSYDRDAAGRVRSVTLPTGEQWAMRYDADGNADQVTTPEGVVSFDHDALDRLLAIDYSDDTPDVSMTYDRNGNRTSQQDGTGVRTFRYDAENRLVAAVRGAEVFGYDYDPAGNVTTRRYPDDRSIGYAYTPDGLLRTVTEGRSTTEYSYDAAGRPVAAVLPNGTSERRGYDAAGRLTSLVHSTASGRPFSGGSTTLDAVGNPLVTRSVDGRARSYAYDREHRLVQQCAAASCPAGSGGGDRVDYTYDQVGNRLTEVRPGQVGRYRYDDADRLTEVVGPRESTTYAYDRNGNRTRAGAATYRYDLANRMVSASVEGKQVDYRYDGDGVLRSAGDLEYQWDLAAPSPLLAQVRDGSTATPFTHGRDLVRAGSSVVHEDVLGTVTDLTDSAGRVAVSYDHDAFGKLLRTTGPLSRSPRQVGYAGMPQDPVTGLTQLLARTYDPATATFLQRDPIAGSVAGPAQSAYAWAGNRPTVLTDPTGQCPFCVLAGVGAVVGGIAGGAAYALTTDEFSWREFGGSAASGAVAGAVAGVAGPLGGSFATAGLTSLGLGAASSTGAVATAATVGITPPAAWPERSPTPTSVRADRRQAVSWRSAAPPVRSADWSAPACWVRCSRRTG